METAISQIKDGVVGGFSVAPQFGKMIQDSFTNTFLTTNASGAVTGLSGFGVVALALTSITIVTGVCMFIFKRFLGGKI